MTELLKCNSKNKDFIKLVMQLDAYLKVTDGDEHEFYNQFNSIDKLDHVVIAYYNNIAVSCGAFKAYDKNKAEIKRMYTLPEYRNKGLASVVIKALEHWALESGYTHTILETGKRQKEAVAFYKKRDYNSIPNYGQYMKMENSLCFEKKLLN